ncbi:MULTISPECIES: hypothetical protein [Mesorhizobium]|uniref:hypothetical protein n=1 Tax=Mesorhizobium TaxID=68287 RepID=UPI0007A94614|nr:MULTISPECIES: hypothetical protein [Mesorhizobium]AMX93630.1 hypothetical protein A4R28_11235 [Mesorhizobium ciceri]MDF3208321.1 hypothetical protein [Mesorhizobium sp. LMG15046]MDF3229107.1 hypothetical protein [Mesorhizobium sp. DSM 30133]RUU22216.1 hypothetical protein EOC84_03655 [Mesorhizobium sp. Primo-B]RUU37874.1 hypothetical protein EOC83_16560 [Mesorhizobium sp. Primo-A]
MKVVKKTGLVPVHSTKTGRIFGVTPDTARKMLREKAAELVNVPEGIETFEVADSVEPKQPAEIKEVTAAPIPDDWESMHHLQKVKLAKTLPGGEDVKTLAAAVEVIGAEIQRRAAAVTPSE